MSNLLLRCGMPSARTSYLEAIAEIFSIGDVGMAPQIFADHYVDHQRPDWLTVDGPEEFVAIVHSARSSLPDLEVSVSGDPVRHEDLEVAILHWVSRPSEGPVVERDTVETVRIEDGRVTEHWGMEIRSTGR